ncbi:hypothetical protein LguiB_034217 [Lonicera macranthoides]
MAILQASRFLISNGSVSSCSQRRITRAAINLPKLKTSPFLLSKISTKDLVEEFELKRSGNTKTNTTHDDFSSNSPLINKKSSDPTVIAKLHLIMESISDRVEMHKNIGEQRTNWNSLLLTSINTITLSAATMAAIAGTSLVGSPSLFALKVSSTLMYLSVTAMLVLMNKIQPSQLAEEQRNAARLFKQLQCQIQTMVVVGSPSENEVKYTTEKVIALDRAYPLPLLGTMLEKFPSRVEPAVWWPKNTRRQTKVGSRKSSNGNGWNNELEGEMREIVKVLRKKDKADYLRLGEKAVRVNKVLAIAGPLLTGIAALGAALVGQSCSCAVVISVLHFPFLGVLCLEFGLVGLSGPKTGLAWAMFK